MKKLLYTLFLFSALFTSACKTNNGSKITAGVKALSKCCQKLFQCKPGNVLNVDKNETAESKDNASSILPSSFWDTKMMIW